MKCNLRFLMSAVAGIAAMALIAPMAQAKMVDHEISGSARTRMIFNDNTTAGDTDSVEGWLNKVRLNLDIMPASGVKVRVSPQFTHAWGGTTDWTAKEAYFGWSPNNQLTLTVGRQQKNYGNGLVIGNQAWEQTTSHWDAVNAHFDFNMGWGDFWFAKVVEGAATGVGLATQTNGTDTDHLGMYLGFDKVNMLKALDVYAMWNDARNHGANRARYGTFGTRMAADFNKIDVGAELTANMGKVATQDIKGVAMDVQVGYNWMDNRVGLGLDYANTEYLAPNASTHRNNLRDHRYMGDAQVMARNNILDISLLSNWGINKNFEASLDGHYFLGAKSDAGSIGGVATADNKRGAGMEADLAAAYMPNDLATFQTGYAMFKPMGAFTDGAFDKVIHRMYLQAGVKF